MGKEDLKVSSEQPLDSVFANLMETTARKGRGFVLDLVSGIDADIALDALGEHLGDIVHSEELTDADKKEKLDDLLPTLHAAIVRRPKGVTIEVKEQLRPHDEWRPPSPYRAHRLETTDSFIEYTQKFADKDRSLVFVAENGCALVIDDRVEKGSREVITLALPKSQDWTDWNEVLGKAMVHKTLHEFLLNHESNLVDGKILAATSSVKVNSSVDYQSDLTDEGKEIGIVFKSSKGDDLKMFPKLFQVTLPVLEMDDQTADYARVDIRLHVEMPSKAEHPPTFMLICSNWHHVLNWRLKQEASKIAGILSDLVVLRGSYHTEPHEVALAKINRD